MGGGGMGIPESCGKKSEHQLGNVYLLQTFAEDQL